MTDKRILERLFRKHYGQMYRQATILLHDDTESKDVVHDVFARLLDDPHELREATAETYLIKCVRNRCLNIIRGRQIRERVRRLYLLDADADLITASYESGFQHEEELKALYRGIELLDPPISRDIIVGHFRDGITFKEMASRLSVSETTVYKHLRRALSELRKQLKNLQSV